MTKTSGQHIKEQDTRTTSEGTGGSRGFSREEQMDVDGAEEAAIEQLP